MSKKRKRFWKSLLGIVLIVVVILILVVLVWGLVGASKASEIGVTCDVGLGKDNCLCWRWHTNLLGEIQEAWNNLRPPSSVSISP